MHSRYYHAVTVLQAKSGSAGRGYVHLMAKKKGRECSPSMIELSSLHGALRGPIPPRLRPSYRRISSSGEAGARGPFCTAQVDAPAS